MKLIQTAVGVLLFLFALISFSGTSYAEEDVSGDEQNVQSNVQKGHVTITLEVPFFSTVFSNTPIALVNGEPILLKELKKEMESFHREMQETMEEERAEASVEGNYIELLNRIINTRLIVEEARNIGLDELPEIQAAIKDFSQKTLRSMLFKRYLDETDLEAPGEEVEKIYREIVKEYRLSSLQFKRKESAESAVEELRSEKTGFDSLAKRLKEEGLAEGTEEGGNFVKVRDLLPHVVEVLKEMKVGSVSPVVNVGGGGYIIFKVEEVKYPDDPEAREQARQQVLSRVRMDAIKAYIESLEEKYAEFNETLLKSIDFDADKPGIDVLLQDIQAVATIEDEEPVTVGDVASALKKKFFHGVERAMGKMNSKKMDVASEIIEKRVLLKEAIHLGFDKSEEYKEKIRNYEQGLLFGAFVDKAVSQDVDLAHEEVEVYYEEHMDDYTAPRMLRIESLVFKKLKYAEDAAEKLRKGTDFKWLLHNAEGQADKDPGRLFDFGGRFWTLSGLPEDVREVVADANAGDIRVYESPDGDFYVMSIVGERPEEPKPFDTVKLSIANKLYGEKLAAAVEEWAAALRKEYEVEVFVLGRE